MKEMRLSIKNIRLISLILIPLLMIIIWQILAIYIDNKYILPRFDSVLSLLLDPFNDQVLPGSLSLFENSVRSFSRVIIGFGIAALIAIPLGMAMARYSLLIAILDPIIQLLRPVPPLAWIPLALSWFGIGLGAQSFIISIGAFFPILINTIDGVKGVKKTWIEAARILGAKEHQIMTHVILPGAAPMIWTGLRIGFGISWMCLVAAEMLPGTGSGIGYMIIQGINSMQMDLSVAGMIVIGLIGILCDTLFRFVETRWFAWRALER